MEATGRGFFNLALVLLEAGANPSIYQQNESQKLSHVVVRQHSRLQNGSPDQAADYNKLIKWLDDHGESVDAAREDIKRWDSWSRTTGEYKRRIKEEIAARKAREKKADGKASEKKE
jgi:hypothetical protein